MYEAEENLCLYSLTSGTTVRIGTYFFFQFQFLPDGYRICQIKK